MTHGRSRTFLWGRRPAGLQVQKALPGFPYMVDGHASVDYDAVALLHVPSVSQVLQWLLDVSNASRTCWVVLGGLEFWSCVYIPPQSSASKKTPHFGFHVFRRVGQRLKAAKLGLVHGL